MVVVVVVADGGRKWSVRSVGGWVSGCVGGLGRLGRWVGRLVVGGWVGSRGSRGCRGLSWFAVVHRGWSWVGRLVGG